jgi:glycosyltransferase involved in cell wall biosynthesis
MAKHILILEFGLGGHYSVYLERIATGYLKGGNKVSIILLNEMRNYSGIKKLSDIYLDKLDFKVVTETEYDSFFRRYCGNYGREFANWLLAKKKYKQTKREAKVDYVFIPFLDHCLNVIGLLGSPFGHTQWSGICMLVSIHHSQYGFINSTTKLNAIKRFIFIRLLKNRSLHTLFTIDELLIKFILNSNIGFADRIQYLPDPAEFVGNHTQASARRLLNIKAEAFVILVYGAIYPRKGLDVLVKALTSSGVPECIQILIVGKQLETMGVFFNSKVVNDLIESGRIHIVNEFVDAGKQQMAFAATDIVWLGYENHFAMSGVLVLAAKARKAVISTNDGLIGWHTREKQLGLTVNLRDITSVKNALIDMSNYSFRLNIQRNINPVFDTYTWENAIKSILGATESFSMVNKGRGSSSI